MVAAPRKTKCAKALASYKSKRPDWLWARDSVLTPGLCGLSEWFGSFVFTFSVLHFLFLSFGGF